eukprot:CAMPEP_0195058276 /NCGR_PEP_ID=MMETSP0448-20130528/6205_1 /TAXON_ID=66468 /ORGANISM="Heterocapsa triquestra, Strain CCMP 448" /LENGTH=49 /DNA_ID=CAMNT_0040088415 /DNA_START=55 /DNA_END=204 /DNA_ORIENTATION=+
MRCCSIGSILATGGPQGAPLGANVNAIQTIIQELPSRYRPLWLGLGLGN